MKLPAIFRRGQVEVGPPGELIEKATDLNTVTPIRDTLRISSPFGWITEAFGGAWQSNLVLESSSNLTAFSAVYACIQVIAGDVSKMRAKLMRLADDGVWDLVSDASPFLPVLRKPNRYQTWLQFLQYWVTGKLLYGNAYIMIERDGRGVVRALYPLDPRGIKPLVAPDGTIYYQLQLDRLAGLREGDELIVEASEIIHDRMNCLWHPLCGVSPIYACAMSGTQGMRIQANSTRFFENMSRPSGHLTTEAKLTDDQYQRIKDQIEKSIGGTNLGRMLITGGGLKFEPFTMPAEDSQLIEQLGWTVQDVARAFGMPLYKIQAGNAPALQNLGALNQEYYVSTLQIHVEGIEQLLDEALSLPGLKMGIELDTECLLRMDPLGRAEVTDKRIKSGVLSPNEARAAENLHGVPGGKYPYLQQQNYSIEALARRDAKEDPFSNGTSKPPAPAVATNDPAPADDPAAPASESAKAELFDLIMKAA